LQVYTKTPMYSEGDLIGKGAPKLYGTGYKLQKKAHQAFLEMNYAARKSGMNIRVVSSYRSFNHQNLIWTRKYKRYRFEIPFEYQEFSWIWYL